MILGRGSYTDLNKNYYWTEGDLNYWYIMFNWPAGNDFSEFRDTSALLNQYVEVQHRISFVP